MKTIYDKYLAIWTDYYSNNQFAGTSAEAAAAYAASDCTNAAKGWSAATIDDDLAYWQAKLSKVTENAK